MADQVRELQAKITASVEGFQSEINSIKQQIGDLPKESEKTSQRLTRSFQKAGKSMQSIGAGMSKAITAPLVAIGTTALASANSVDKAYKNIRIGTGAVGEDLEKLEESFDNVFKDVPEDADTVSNALAGLNTMTGATDETLEGLTKSVLDVSRMLGEDGVQNAEAFGSTLQQWNIEAEDGEAVMDQLFKVTQDYGIGLNELTGQLNNYGPVLQNANFSMEESADLFGRLNKEGISVSRIMPGLNKAFRTWADEGKNGREELDKVMNSMQEAGSEAEALAIATEIFGAEGAQRMTTAIRGGAIPSLDELAKGLDDVEGLVDETGEATLTFGERMARLKNNVTTALEPIGSVLLGMAENILPPLERAVERLSNWFGSLSEANQRWLVILGLIASALGPVIMALGTFLATLAPIFTTVSRLGPVFAKLAPILSKLRLAFAVMTGPIGITVAILTTLIGILVTSYKRFDSFRNIVDNVAGTVKDGLVFAFERARDALRQVTDFLTSTFGPVFSKAKDVATDVIDTIASFFKQEIGDMLIFWELNGGQLLQAFQNIFTGISIAVQWAWGFIQTAFRQISDVIRKVIDLIRSETDRLNPIIETLRTVIGNTFGAIKNIIENTMSLALDIIKNAWDMIKSVFSGAMEAIKGIIQLFSGIFTGDFQQMWNGIQNIWQGAMEILSGILRNLFKTAVSIITTLMKNIWELMKSGWDNVSAIVSGAVSFIYQYIKTWFNRKLAEIQRVLNLIKAFIQGSWRAIRDHTSDFVSSIYNRVRNAWTNTLDKTREIFTNIKNSIKESFDDAVDMAKKLPKRIGDGLKRMGKHAVNGAIDVVNSIGNALEKGVNFVVDGLNDVLGLVGFDGDPIPTITIADVSKYKHGTGASGHEGGPAVVGDGRKRELIQTPDGKTYLSPDRDTLVDLPKGTSVLSGPKTENLLQELPFYQWGVGEWVFDKLGSAKDFIQDKASDFMNWAFEGGKKVIEKLIDSFDIQLPQSDDFFGYMIRGGFNTAMDALAGIFDNKAPEEGFTGTGSSEDVKRWIQRAMDITGVPASWAGALETIAMHESGGNPSIINTWDINARRGTPSIGLMQTIGPTFNAYKMRGMNDITNPIHNAVAAIRYIQARYGTVFNTPGIKSMSRGGPYKGYADGGRIPQTDWALVGEEGPELVKLPTGAEVLSNRESKKQYSDILLSRAVIQDVYRGIDEADSMSDVDIERLINDARESAWSNSPARNKIRQRRRERENNIALLEKEIELLTREDATQEELNEAREKMIRLDELRAQKVQQYKNEIRDEETILKRINTAYDEGRITTNQYQTAVQSVRNRINDLRMNAMDLNQTIGQEQREEIQKTREEWDEYAQEVADHFEEVAQKHEEAFSKATERGIAELEKEQEKELDLFDDRTEARLEAYDTELEKALDTFDSITKAHEASINQQISDIKRRRDERIQAIQDELDAMDEEDQEREREQQEEAWNEERDHLQRRLQIAEFMKDDATRQAVVEEIADLEEEIAEQRREWERADRREALQAEQDRLKDKADARIEELEQDLSTYQDEREAQRKALEQSYQEERDSYEKRRELRRTALEERLSDELTAYKQEREQQARHLEALREALATHVANRQLTQQQAQQAWVQAIQDFGDQRIAEEMNKQRQAEEALNSYVSNYLDIGRSFGRSLIGGLLGSMDNGLRDVQRYAGRLAQTVSGVFGGVGPILSGLSRLRVPAMAQGGVVTGPTLSIVGEGSHPEAVMPLSPDVLSQLGQEISKHTGSDQPINILLDGKQIAGYTFDHMTGEIRQQFRKG